MIRAKSLLALILIFSEGSATINPRGRVSELTRLKVGLLGEEGTNEAISWLADKLDPPPRPPALVELYSPTPHSADKISQSGNERLIRTDAMFRVCVRSNITLKDCIK